MSISQELVARGFIHQTSTDDIAAILDDTTQTIYHGIDPSADSAHAGNFVNWMLLRHLAGAGHKIIFLVGGGTGMIGDPKPDAERVLSTPEEVAARVAKLKHQAERIFGDHPVQFVNNYDWLSTLDLISFLRDIGKHFTINELIKKDAIATRLASETGLSYTEFAYPLLQAYDYLTLYRTHGCTLQVGGSDQWGNIIAGVDLVRRLEQVSVHALTVPLVVDKTTGKKFGKSEGNAVWLDAEKTSPYEFYQFWVNTADENVADYLKLFTTISLEEIAVLITRHETNSALREAQKVLAEAVTTIVHGAAAAGQAVRVSEVLFGGGSLGELSVNDVAYLRSYGPTTVAADGVSVVEVLVALNLATSKREARTFVESGAVKIQGEVVTDVDGVLAAGITGAVVKVQRGKKQVAIAVLE